MDAGVQDAGVDLGMKVVGNIKVIGNILAVCNECSEEVLVPLLGDPAREFVTAQRKPVEWDGEVVGHTRVGHTRGEVTLQVRLDIENIRRHLQFCPSGNLSIGFQ